MLLTANTFMGSRCHRGDSQFSPAEGVWHEVACQLRRARNHQAVVAGSLHSVGAVSAAFRFLQF